MNDGFYALGAILAVGVVAFLLIPLIALLAGTGAWITGLFFGDMIAETFMRIFQTTTDLRDIGYFKVGVTLGFLGGFFKSVSTSK